MKTIEHESTAGLIQVPEPSFSKRGLPVEQHAQPTSLIQAIVAAASNPQIDMDRAERLFRMHEEMVKREAESAFNDAMARAQSLMQPIARNQRNNHTNSKYADLAALCDAITPIYTAEGLAVSFDTETKNDADPIAAGDYRTVAYITHRMGHKDRRHIDLALDDVGSAGKVNKTKVQAKGSTTSFARRYLLLMIFNLATMDDDDGDGGRKERERHEAGRKDEPKTESGPQAYAQDKFDAALPAWQDLVNRGHRKPEQIIATVERKYKLSDAQRKKITDLKPAAIVVTVASVDAQLRKATTKDDADVALSLAKDLEYDDREKLRNIYQEVIAKFNK